MPYTRLIILALTSLSLFGSLGLLFMMSFSAGSYASAIEGHKSVPRSMNRIVTVERGRGMEKTTWNRKGAISGMLLQMYPSIELFWVFRKISFWTFKFQIVNSKIFNYGQFQFWIELWVFRTFRFFSTNLKVFKQVFFKNNCRTFSKVTELIRSSKPIKTLCIWHIFLSFC